jgi:hypothetical protein
MHEKMEKRKIFSKAIGIHPFFHSAIFLDGICDHI